MGWRAGARRGEDGRQGRGPAAGGGLARRRQGRGAGDGGIHLGLLAAPGGRQARARAGRRLHRLGLRRLRRGRGHRGRPQDPRRWRAAAPQLRRHQRARLGSRAGLRRQDPGLRRARRMKLALLEKALAASRAGRAAVLATHLESGRQSFLEGSEIMGNLSLDTAALAAVRKAVGEDRSGTLDTAEGPVLVEVFKPRLRCLIVGAVHIAQPLARMASIAGYLVTVVDPRTAFASDARLPDVPLSTDWPDEALAKFTPNRRTAVVTLTHDPKLDDPALATALRSDAFYIGALGSKKTHAARLKRLQALGFGDAQLGRIPGPVGPHINPISPARIALALLGHTTQGLPRDAIPGPP